MKLFVIFALILSLNLVDEKEVHEIKKVNESILFGDKEGG